MNMGQKLLIATLNVKGLNDSNKQSITLTLIKSYGLDIIMLQETNLYNEATRRFLKKQWSFDSVWTKRTAILAGKKEIKFEEIETKMDDRVITLKCTFQGRQYNIENVYAPPNIEDRAAFFNDWTPNIKDEGINIIAGDINTNLEPEVNRISQAAPQRDPSQNILRHKVARLNNATEFGKEKPFLTFFQNTSNNRTMGTCIDYIFVGEEHGQYIEEVTTLYGNSDHLLVKCTLNFGRSLEPKARWVFDKYCIERKEIRQEIITELGRENVEEEWDMCKVNVQSIIRAYRRPKRVETELARINKKLVKMKTIKAKGHTGSNLDAQIRDLEIKAKNESLKLAEKWASRSKAKWVEKGEKSTKYFFAKLKERQISRGLEEIKVPKSEREQGVNTLQWVRKYYANLYKEEEIDPLAAEEILSDLPEITEDMNELLTRQITGEEIMQVIKKLPNNKSPGCDGLSYEFYKEMSETVVVVLEKVFNKVLRDGKMPVTWHKSLVTLIPKKSENLEEVQNWRPISMVNCDAKIFMKILADRLNSICEELILDHQQGFVTKRSITNAAMDIITTLRSQREQTDTHWMLLVDQAKAFDRVSHEFMGLVLKRMKFDPRITSVLINLFNSQEAHIIVKNELSLPFRVERGVRQGDPLSPLLFVLTFEPLLRQLRRNIRGIPIENQFFKLSAYADDLSIGIGSASDWNTISKWFEIYERASNAKINKDKTKLVPLTPTVERVVLRNENLYKKVLEQEAVKVLGYEVNRDSSAKKELWAKVITNMKKQIEKLKSRDLSFKGKILVAKVLILSKVWYTAYILNPVANILPKSMELSQSR